MLQNSNITNNVVSIIVASYNKSKFIAETIQSVIEQTFQNWELIIVDDKSSDETETVVAKYVTDKRIKFYRNDTNKGANFCRNFGIRASRGDYLIFLDADDVLEPWCLETRLKKFEEQDQVDVCVFSMGVFGSSNGIKALGWQPRSKKPLIDFLRHDLPWSILQPMWKKKTIVDAGGFDENFSRLQDVEFHTRVLLNSQIKIAQYCGLADCNYRIDSQRKNFSEFEFATKWMTSSVQFCEKFKSLPPNLALNLIGTLFQSYLSLIYLRNEKKISLAEFSQLEKVITSCSVYQSRKGYNNFIFGVTKNYNLIRIRIPGINRLLKAALYKFTKLNLQHSLL